jgi:hypothetical protein
MENDTIVFYVPVKTPVRLGLKLKAPTPTTILPDVSTQSVFQDLRTRALTDLMNTSNLFKNKPTLESLESITPKWGVVYQDSAKAPQASWSSYTHLVFDTDLSYPCIADLELTSIQITRSTICPTFQVVFLDKESPTNVIDFEWSAASAPVNKEVKDVEEVDDIPALETDTGILQLRDPVKAEQEKQDAKDYVRSLFRSADEARQQAMDAMRAFFDTYSPDDDESNFSEWMAEESVNEQDDQESQEDDLDNV